MKKHYHVLEGLQGGYIPDSNDFCATLTLARQCMKYSVYYARDAQAQSNNYKPFRKNANGDYRRLRMGEFPWTGSIRSGYYENGIEYVAIEECTEADCQDEGEY